MDKKPLGIKIEKRTSKRDYFIGFSFNHSKKLKLSRHACKKSFDR